MTICTLTNGILPARMRPRLGVLPLENQVIARLNTLRGTPPCGDQLLHSLCYALGVHRRWLGDGVGVCCEATPAHVPVQLPVGPQAEVVQH
jgi:hypothetical protein